MSDDFLISSVCLGPQPLITIREIQPRLSPNATWCQRMKLSVHYCSFAALFPVYFLKDITVYSQDRHYCVYTAQTLLCFHNTDIIVYSEHTHSTKIDSVISTVHNIFNFITSTTILKHSKQAKPNQTELKRDGTHTERLQAVSQSEKSRSMQRSLLLST